MLKVGLTGGIGSGKSTVSKIFEVLGVPVYYADDAAKRLMNTSPELRKSIIAAFGEQSYRDNVLDRAYMASQVFTSKEKLEQLNALTHPATINDANEWMQRQQSPYTIKEAALIFESGSNQHLDYVIGISSPLQMRLQRVMERDNISKQEVEARMNRQMNEEEKMRLCDFIIYNDEQQPLIAQVLELHQRFLRQVGTV